MQPGEWLEKFHVKQGEAARQKINAFLAALKKKNSVINLYSRKTSDQGLETLLTESGLLCDLLSCNRLIDVGSGNGLLGIPIAVWRPSARVVLVECVAKKARALEEFKDSLLLPNVEVFHGTLFDFISARKKEKHWLVARGFPALEDLMAVVAKKSALGLTAITAAEKCLFLLKKLDCLQQKVYNIAWRENLVIAEIKHVSRGTGKNKE